eukprot:CAMPEP_0173170280 /NCGR_PEP_ID=MMETSP1141-20130122/1150_1 /TAXON_ID=483371 /ORGANISM="non described non described, Strain CCMP2298" /LENGTH=89 /DNA_ID=CAMNT_0014092157 /DNA_START=437 /DNA_END=706 /DNA_ORIENTATION=-
MLLSLHLPHLPPQQQQDDQQWCYAQQGRPQTRSAVPPVCCHNGPCYQAQPAARGLHLHPGLHALPPHLQHTESGEEQHASQAHHLHQHE